MKKLINSLVVVLLCMGTLLSCEETQTIVEETTELKEVRIAVVLPAKDREPIWNNALNWAAENIRKANIGVKVVYEWVDEASVNITEAGVSLSEREDIRSIIGCNVSANTQKLAFALARKKENIKPLFTSPPLRSCPESSGIAVFFGACAKRTSRRAKSCSLVFPTRILESRRWHCSPLTISMGRRLSIGLLSKP